MPENKDAKPISKKVITKWSSFFTNDTLIIEKNAAKMAANIAKDRPLKYWTSILKTIRIPDKANKLKKTSNNFICFLKKSGSMILTQKEVVPMPTKQTAAVDIFADKKKSIQWVANKNPTITVFNKERRELNTKDRFIENIIMANKKVEIPVR